MVKSDTVLVKIPEHRIRTKAKLNRRAQVLRYLNYKRSLKLEFLKHGLKINEVLEGVTFVMPMPPSWSKKKRDDHRGKKHQQVPDLDNLVKAFKDAILKRDEYVHTYNDIKKVWGDLGEINIK